MPQVYLEEEQKKGKKKIIILITIFALIILVTLVYYRYMRKQMTIAMPETKEIKELSIIYPVSQYKLTKKTVQIKHNTPDKMKFDIIAKALKDEKAIPDGLLFYDYVMDDNGIIHVNMSNHMIEGLKEPFQEVTALYSIINTFIANTENAKAVQVLVDGRPVYTLKGIVYTYMPLPYNNDLMEE